MAAMMGPRSRVQASLGAWQLVPKRVRQYVKDIPQQLMSWLQHDLEQASAGSGRLLVSIFRVRCPGHRGCESEFAGAEGSHEFRLRLCSDFGP